jgi:hypothetical protein
MLMPQHSGTPALLAICLEVVNIVCVIFTVVFHVRASHAAAIGDYITAYSFATNCDILISVSALCIGAVILILALTLSCNNALYRLARYGCAFSIVFVIAVAL